MTTPSAEPSVRRAPSRKRPADFTGKQTERLNEERKAEIIEASQRIALVNQEIAEAKNEIVDYTDSPEPLPEVEVRVAEVSTPYRMIRVNSDIDQMTYGREVLDPGDYTSNPPRPAIMGPMKFYSFNEGQLYRVTKDLAEHLSGLGYIAYMSGA